MLELVLSVTLCGLYTVYLGWFACVLVRFVDMSRGLTPMTEGWVAAIQHGWITERAWPFHQNVIRRDTDTTKI